jgi:hypothetical protein
MQIFWQLLDAFMVKGITFRRKHHYFESEFIYEEILDFIWKEIKSEIFILEISLCTVTNMGARQEYRQGNGCKNGAWFREKNSHVGENEGSMNILEFDLWVFNAAVEREDRWRKNHGFWFELYDIEYHSEI